MEDRERRLNLYYVRILKEIVENMRDMKRQCLKFLFERFLFFDLGILVNLKKDKLKYMYI